jgi:AcrR family transcriptional regulator
VVGVKSSTRKYHSPLRANQAKRTKRAILQAALRLFVDRGYAATTVAAVAVGAGVSPETVYLSFGGKRGLLEGVIEMAISGTDDSADDEATLSEAMGKLATARQRLNKLVGYSSTILARTRPIHAVIRGAADKEPFAAALSRRLLHDRLAAQTERIRRYVSHDLRPGLSVSEAGQRYCALASPELYYLLTVELNWTAEQHSNWLSQLLQTELFGVHVDEPITADEA